MTLYQDAINNWPEDEAVQDAESLLACSRPKVQTTFTSGSSRKGQQLFTTLLTMMNHLLNVISTSSTT